MPASPPFRAGQHDTPLSFLEELAFRGWLDQNNVPFERNAGATDYDMRGYWRGLRQGSPMARPSEINPNDNRPHYPDYYKTPQHQSFSSGSQWAGPDAAQWVNGHQLAAPNGRVVFDERPASVLSQLLGMR